MVCEVFIYLEKAFDTVDHTLLLNKLPYCGMKVLQIGGANLT